MATETKEAKETVKEVKEAIETPRIGLFICRWRDKITNLFRRKGINIAGIVDVPKLVEYGKKLEHVVVSEEYLSMCTEPGAAFITEKVQKNKLNRVIVAACTPKTHEPVFHAVLKAAGLPPRMLEFVNIREHCSFVHMNDPAAALHQAKNLIRAAVQRALYLEAVPTKVVPVNPEALVVGGGIAGLSAALDLANQGFKVYLVEKELSIGGRMSQMDRTYPTDDCAIWILGPKMLEAGRHPNIQIMSYCDITEVTGFIGNFVVKIKQKPRYVDEDLCTNCGLCRDKCPVSYPNQFDMGFSPRKAIDIPFPQAVPTVYSIDMNTCVKCYYCVSVCNVHCIDFSQQPKEYTVKVGTIIIATGWDIYEPKNSFGYGIYENVLNQLQLERILAPNGPTLGHLVRPSDGKRPKRVLMINCVGSRDVCANAFCPGVCCLVSIKNAKLIISEYPDTEAIISAIDIRTPGKDYEEYYRRAREFGISFIKGMVGNLEEDPLTKNLIVTLENSQTGEIKELEVDMVILSTAPVASKGTNEIAQVMRLEKSADGYLKEYHARLNPIDTKTFGIYIAGMAQGPKAIDASVSQGRGAASSASIPMHAGKFEIELIRAVPDNERCSLCGECIAACPFKALKIENNTLVVDEIACRGCGACAATCKSKSITIRYFRDNAFESYIDALLAPLEE